MSEKTYMQILRGRAVTHDEAAASADRLINSRFGQPNGARASFPVRPDDDDMIIVDYILERRASDPIHSVPAAAPERPIGSWAKLAPPNEPKDALITAIEFHNGRRFYRVKQCEGGLFLDSAFLAASSPAPVAPPAAATCSICGALLVCLPCGNHRDEILKEALEALRLACGDAWPNQPQWPDLYLKQARANLHLRERKTT